MGPTYMGVPWDEVAPADMLNADRLKAEALAKVFEQVATSKAFSGKWTVTYEPSYTSQLGKLDEALFELQKEVLPF